MRISLLSLSCISAKKRSYEKIDVEELAFPAGGVEGAHAGLAGDSGLEVTEGVSAYANVPGAVQVGVDGGDGDLLALGVVDHIVRATSLRRLIGLLRGLIRLLRRLIGLLRGLIRLLRRLIRLLRGLIRLLRRLIRLLRRLVRLLRRLIRLLRRLIGLLRRLVGLLRRLIRLLRGLLRLVAGDGLTLSIRLR